MFVVIGLKTKRRIKEADAGGKFFFYGGRSIAQLPGPFTYGISMTTFTKHLLGDDTANDGVDGQGPKRKHTLPITIEDPDEGIGAGEGGGRSLEDLKADYHHHMDKAKEIFDQILRRHHALATAGHSSHSSSPSSPINADLSPLNQINPLSSISSPTSLNSINPWPSAPPPAPQPSVSRGGIVIKGVKHHSKALSRKPRELCFNASGDSFMATSLDGGVFFWDAAKREMRSVSYLTSYLHRIGHAECAGWLDTDTVVLACDNAGNDSANGTDLLALTQGRQFRTLGSLADRSVTALHCWCDGDILLGSQEKTVDILKDTNGHRRLHSCHTSAVHALYAAQDAGSVVYSGGADRRLVAYDAVKDTRRFDGRYEHRISHIQPINVHNHLLLVTFCCSEDNQLRLLDTRTMKFAASAGWRESANLSRYVRPSVNCRHGDLVACGTSAPLGETIRPGSLLLWDVRQLLNRNSQPALVVNVAREQRFLRTEFRPSGTTPEIVAMSTDGALSFVDYDNAVL
jgi:WD40 repeat protein